GGRRPLSIGAEDIPRCRQGAIGDRRRPVRGLDDCLLRRLLVDDRPDARQPADADPCAPGVGRQAPPGSLGVAAPYRAGSCRSPAAARIPPDASDRPAPRPAGPARPERRRPRRPVNYLEFLGLSLYAAVYPTLIAAVAILLTQPRPFRLLSAY